MITIVSVRHEDLQGRLVWFYLQSDALLLAADST
jgi:hypothetical protein